jgi:hypothetical protein
VPDAATEVKKKAALDFLDEEISSLNKAKAPPKKSAPKNDGWAEDDVSGDLDFNDLEI